MADTASHHSLVLAKPLIAVDALAIGARGKGAARVLVNLLARLPSADSELNYVALATDEGAVEIRRKAPSVDVLVLAPRSGAAWELSGVARAATLARADLIFTVREIVPSGGPPVCLHVFEPPIYRLRGFRPRDMMDARRLAKDVLLSALFTRSVRRAHTVTAGSEATAAWLLRHARRGAEVVLPGIDPVFFGTADQVVSESPYVLHPASGDARENTDLVLQAFGTGGLEGIRLVLVGTPESLQRRIGERAKQLGVSVELPGWVTDERLRELYRGAVAVVTPSRYEGYAGYPALEAMALGTPVVAIEAPGVTEALRGRGILLSEPDPVLLADAIRRLQQDDALRRELGESGRVHARSLTWDASAVKFAAVFRQALQSRA
jgi:glycosyltransferase involved in cell wall biosynthesis